MIAPWQRILERAGAVIENGAVAHYGHPSDELTAAAAGETVIADLTQLGVIAFSGEDTVTFLQGQLTNDVRALGADAAQWNGCCTPKGRLYGNFLMWRAGDDVCMQMSRDIVASVLKRLSMFVLRSKTRGRDASDERVRLVVAGRHASTAVCAACGATPDAPMHTLEVEAGSVIRVAADKFVLALAPEAAEAVWNTLCQHARPVGAPVWDWMRLTSGIPMIVAATQEAFVPQMVNLEVLGGVSFNKGCYTGQEIVARSQYLGKLKRRMLLAHSTAPAQAGDALYSPASGGQAIGTVANAAPAPGGGYDLLAVVQTETAAGQPVSVGSPGGSPLVFRPLPYALPE